MGAGIDVANWVKQGTNDSATPTAASVDQAIRQRGKCPGFTKAADDAVAADTTAETPIGSRGVAIKVKTVWYQAKNTITADATNNATITVSKRTKAGASKTTIGTLVTNLATGNFAAFERKDFTLTATTADLECAADSVFTFEIAKGGTGVVVRAGEIGIEFEEI